MSAYLLSPLRELALEPASRASAGWPAWVPWSVIATLVVAVVGWVLVARYRQQDHTRADLAPISAILEGIDLEIRRLAHSPGTAVLEDFATLRELQTRVERAAERAPAALKPAMTEVAKHVCAYTATGMPPIEEVTTAYLAATTADAIPAQWSLELLLGRAQQQGRAHSDLAAAIAAAENAITRMLAR